MNNERHADDLYETPAAAVEMLLAHHDVQGPVLEPSAGKGAIANVLRGHGYDVVAYDLHEWYGSTNVEPGVDFLQESDTRGCKTIIANPPYRDADAHVRHALNILPQHGVLCVLLRLTWIAAKKRADLLPHIEKIVIVGRVRMLPPNVVDKGLGGTVDFCWLVMRPHRLPLGTVIVRAA
jgi:hypothetical protein